MASEPSSVIVIVYWLSSFIEKAVTSPEVSMTRSIYIDGLLGFLNESCIEAMLTISILAKTVDSTWWLAVFVRAIPPEELHPVTRARVAMEKMLKSCIYCFSCIEDDTNG